jgi:NO-binding membrane sensor protein with MHYT domain
MEHHMSHDGPLVLLSFAVALFASYTALDMGTRLRRAAGKARKLWLLGSSVVLGGGIWSMHFIAMLAFNAGVPVGYAFGPTALSLLIAIGIVAVGFHIVTGVKASVPRQIAAGCIVGCGVAVMHYTGMSAMVVSGTISYDPLLVAASILVAIVAATAALWLTLNVTDSWQQLAAAAVMAVAVCGMHYTAMLATSFAISPNGMNMADPLSNALLAAAVSVGVFLILCLALVCVFVDRRFELLAEREAESLRAANLRLHGETEERQAIALQLVASNTSLTETQIAIRNLLDHADQGFLTVGADLLVGAQSSAACEAILGETPAGKSIVELLHTYGSPGPQTTMRATLESIFRETTPFIRDLKLELLPTTFGLGGRSVKVSYKYLSVSNRLMLILTDVTETKLLTEAVDRERKRLEMIVLAVTEGAAFSALVSDYRKFLNNELSALLDETVIEADGKLRRRLHTYKGLLAQFSFHYSPQSLHDLETRLLVEPELALQSAMAALEPEKLLGELKRDLESVDDVLVWDMGSSSLHLTLSQPQLETMRQVAIDTLDTEEGRAASASLRQLLQTLAGLAKLDVKAVLALHGRGAIALSRRLGKQLAPIQFRGDNARLSSEVYGDFFGSLVHVFRNAVDHGIETPEEREATGKTPEGNIWCDIRDHGDRVEIQIKDDGRGIARRSLEDKLITSGLGRPQVEALSLGDLVFREGLSSRDTVSEVSGRGIGLGAVKAELERLGGSFAVETEHGAGSRFCFVLATIAGGPLSNIPDKETVLT